MRLNRKLEAVLRTLAGDDEALVAKEVGVEPSRLQRWQGTFLSAGRNALRYTADPGEIPTLRAIRDSAQRGFPFYLVGTARSAAAFFCAEFYGRTDVVHLYKLGLRDVTLVDLDEEKLAQMARIYPDRWQYIVGDAFQVVDELHSAGRRFDLVTCDAYESERVAFETFDRFASLANQFLVTNFRQSMLDALGVPAEPGALGAALASKHGRPARCIDLTRRSTHGGGVYWATFEVSNL